jgi:hypothetical protein
MKISEFKQFIREEIQAVLKEEAPKPRYKKDDKFIYRGINYTVISDNGYVVKAVSDRGDEATYNYNQLNQGVYKRPNYLNEEEGGVSLENFQTYNDLPETDREVPKKDMRYIDTFIMLPNVGGEDGFIYSKEKAKKWLDNYKTMFEGEEPKFTTEVISIAGKDNIMKGTIVSDGYLAYTKKMKDYEASPEYQANVSSFYDKLGYKGD